MPRNGARMLRNVSQVSVFQSRMAGVDLIRCDLTRIDASMLSLGAILVAAHTDGGAVAAFPSVPAQP
jgi:hypothetical protein